MITATILTKNSEKMLEKTLESIRDFPEILILDSGSTDTTLIIAKKFPKITIHTSPFLGFGPMHNYAAKLSSNDWILSIDSDEVLTEELVEEILSLELNPQCVYAIERENFFNDKRIKWCGGWYPDVVLRLYHRKNTKFSGDLVHEKVIIGDLDQILLKHPMIHTPYLEISDFLQKMQQYTTLFAEQKHVENISIFHALFHSWFAFIKSYIFKRGFLGGKEGFIISMYNAHTAFYKYLKLEEKNQK